MSEYIIDEYDPFKPLLLWDAYAWRLEADSDPMTDQDWEEWLEADDYD